MGDEYLQLPVQGLILYAQTVGINVYPAFTFLLHGDQLVIQILQSFRWLEDLYAPFPSEPTGNPFFLLSDCPGTNRFPDNNRQTICEQAVRFPLSGNGLHNAEQMYLLGFQ